MERKGLTNIRCNRAPTSSYCCIDPKIAHINGTSYEIIPSGLSEFSFQTAIGETFDQ